MSFGHLARALFFLNAEPAKADNTQNLKPKAASQQLVQHNCSKQSVLGQQQAHVACGWQQASALTAWTAMTANTASGQVANAAQVIW